jgi:hypothetical protein
MLDRLYKIQIFTSNWNENIPVLRYVLGTCFILAVNSLMNYELSFLTSVLALGYMAPGAMPLTFKEGLKFIITLSIITGLAVIFSEFFIDYPLVFMPLLALGILWLYYSDKLPLMVKLFSLISILLIPLLSLEGSGIGSFIAVSLVFNALMAVTLSQLVFLAFPLCEADKVFEKEQQNVLKKSDKERLNYALNILFILLPLLLLFFIFKLSGGTLILIFAAILSMSPALANIKVGTVMIAANIMGGLFAILAYNLLVIVPLFPFMILITLGIGLFFGDRLFSSNKLAAIFGTGFSTFLLILRSVTSSEDEAGDKVWTRVIQISIAVIYVVIAFRILNYFEEKNRVKKL